MKHESLDIFQISMFYDVLCYKSLVSRVSTTSALNCGEILKLLFIPVGKRTSQEQVKLVPKVRMLSDPL